MKVLLIDMIINGIPLSLRTLATYAEHDPVIKENIEFDLLNFKPGEDFSQFLKALYNLSDQADMENIGLNLEEYIKDTNPQVIALSVWLYNYLYVKTLSKFIRSKFPHIKIIMGGSGVLYPNKFLSEHDEVEIYCYGKQGEEAFTDIFKHYLGLKHVSEINGIYYRENNSILKTDYQEQRLDASKTLGVYHRFPIQDNLCDLDDVRVMYEIKRGCPFKCTYCAWGNITYAFSKDLDECIAEINSLPDNCRLEIIDASLNTPDHIYVLSRIKTTFKRVLFFSNLAVFPKRVDEFFEVLKRFPKVLLRIGIQSFQPKILKAIERKDYNSRLPDWIAKRPPNVTFDLLITLGLPYQTADIVKEELALLSEYGQVISISPLHALPTTKVAETYKEWGAVFEQEYPFQVIKTDYLTEAECSTFRRNIPYIEASRKVRSHEEFVEWLRDLKYEEGPVGISRGSCLGRDGIDL